MMIFRRKYFIYPEIQKPILIQIISGVLILSVLQIGLIYLSMFWLERSTQLNLSILVDARVLGPWKKLLILSLVIPTAMNLMISTFIALYISNKFAGPIFRIEKEIDSHLINKNKSSVEPLNIKLRKNDYLKSLALKINQLTAK